MSAFTYARHFFRVFPHLQYVSFRRCLYDLEYAVKTAFSKMVIRCVQTTDDVQIKLSLADRRTFAKWVDPFS